MQEIWITSPAEYFLLHVYVSLSKINNKFMVTSFASKKTSKKPKVANTQCYVAEKFTCVYSDRQNCISDEQQLMYYWAC